MSHNTDHNKGKENDRDNLKTSETDMLISGLANEDKLISDKKRWHYAEDGLDDQLEKYTDKKSEKNEKTEKDKTDSRSDYEKEKLYDDKSNNIREESERDRSRDRDQDQNTETQKTKSETEQKPELTRKQRMINKLQLLRKLVELANSGVKLSQNYNMDSDEEMMEYEYELHKSIRAKQNGINWMSSLCLSAIHGLEFMNDKYDPFSIKISGWSEQMAADQNNYYDVFGEIYEKYNQPGKSVAPELKLLFMLSGSAIKFHLQHQMSSSMQQLGPAEDPQVAEYLRQKAISEKIKTQTQSANTNMQQSVQKEHKEAVQKVSDLNAIRQNEMNQLKTQRDLSANKTALDTLQNNLKIPTFSPSTGTHIDQQFQPTLTIPHHLQQMMNSQKNSHLTKQEDNLKKQQINNLNVQQKTVELEKMRVDLEYKNAMDRIRNKGKNKDTESIGSKSVHSIIKINKDLTKILSAHDSDTDSSISLGKKSDISKSKTSSKSKKIKSTQRGINILV